MKDFLPESKTKLKEIKKKNYDNLDESSKSEYDGLKKCLKCYLTIDFE